MALVRRTVHATPSPMLAPPAHESGEQAPALPPELIPAHVAIVMDGNGRWANQRNLPRTKGHEVGEEVLLDVVAGAIEMGIKHLSVYAFSTENWKRSPEEVRFLMGFNRDVLRRRREVLHSWGVKIRWSGQRTRVWSSVMKELQIAEEVTQNNTVLDLNMCINYGGRYEIAQAAQALAQRVAEGKMKASSIDENAIARYLNQPDLPDVDLFWRTSGEQRISNFQLWASAYAEMVFSEVLWPDVDRRNLWDAVVEYAKRDRRYGGAIDRPEGS